MLRQPAFGPEMRRLLCVIVLHVLLVDALGLAAAG